MKFLLTEVLSDMHIMEHLVQQIREKEKLDCTWNHIDGQPLQQVELIEKLRESNRLKDTVKKYHNLDFIMISVKKDEKKPLTAICLGR